MKNSDLKRFYKGSGIDPKDFVRLGQDGKIPGDLLPETGPTILELSDVSGTLTNEQYELASGDNCVIALGTQRYYKMYDAATLIVYQTGTRQAGQDSALYEYIEITKSTKAWEYKNDNIVAANPTLEGTESELTGIEIGGTKYKVPEVIANPTLEGTEDDLTGLEVNGVKYKAGGGGGTLFEHNISMVQSNTFIYLRIINDSQSQISTIPGIAAILHARGCRSGYANVYSCSGSRERGSTGAYTANHSCMHIIGIYSGDGTTLTAICPYTNFSEGASGYQNETYGLSGAYTINDHVTAL